MEFEVDLKTYHLVTLRVKGMSMAFGTCEDGAMQVNKQGELLAAFLTKQRLIIDSFVVMPNYAHLLIGVFRLFDPSGQIRHEITDIKGKYTRQLRQLGLDWPGWETGYDQKSLPPQRIAHTYQELLESPKKWARDPANPRRGEPTIVDTNALSAAVLVQYRTSMRGIIPDQLQGFCVGWYNPLTPEQLHQILKNSSHLVLALDKQTKQIIGFINALSDKVNFAFIPMLEVLPSFQKRGIGSELMRRMLAQLEHISCIDLTCDADMQPFYERFRMLRSQGMVIRRYL